MLAWLLSLIHRFCLPKRWLTLDQLADLHSDFHASGLKLSLFDGMWWQADADLLAERVTALMTSHGLTLSERSLAALNGETWRQRLGALVFETFTKGTTCRCCLGWRVILLIVCCVGAGFATGRL